MLLCLCKLTNEMTLQFCNLQRLFTVTVAYHLGDSFVLKHKINKRQKKTKLV